MHYKRMYFITPFYFLFCFYQMTLNVHQADVYHCSILYTFLQMTLSVLWEDVLTLPLDVIFNQTALIIVMKLTADVRSC